jgi:hypothetical protein
MRGRIYQRPKSAMQSGEVGTGNWVLDYAQAQRLRNDPLMGWWGGQDTQAAQVSLRFSSKEDAIAYAQAQRIAFDLELPPVPPALKPKAYADNFRTGRAEPWSH